MGVLIDTSIFVAWERGDLDLDASIAENARSEEAFLSTITASELLHGVHRAENAQRRGRRQAFVESILGRLAVLPIDLDVARIHAAIWADLRMRGVPIGAHDLWIAATAVAGGHAVVTRNVREFERVEGLAVLVW